MQNYLHDFWENEDGMEFLQFAIIVVLSVGLIVVVAYLFTQISNKVGDAGDSVAAMDTNTHVNTNPNNNTP